MENGVPLNEEAGPMLIPRKDVLTKVSYVITPEPSPIGYGLISGSHGSGKSTACYHAARAIGHGIVLFEVPANVDEHFTKELGDSVGFKFDEDYTTLDLIKTSLGIATHPKGTF
jgi:hypothetical protein